MSSFRKFYSQTENQLFVFFFIFRNASDSFNLTFAFCKVPFVVQKFLRALSALGPAGNTGKSHLVLEAYQTMRDTDIYKLKHNEKYPSN